MLIGLIVFFGLSFLIIAHEAGHFFAAKWFGLKVDEFGFGFPPRMFAWRPKEKGETEYSLNWLPFGGFVRIAGENDRIQEDVSKFNKLSSSEKRRIFMFQPAWKRAVVFLAGVAVNFILGWWLLTAVFLIGTPQALVVTDVQSGSPAEVVGLLRGDVLSGFTSSDEFIAFVNARRGEPTDFTIRRGEETLVVSAVPRAVIQEGEGALGVLLGETGVSPQPFFGAVGLGFTHAAQFSWFTLTSFLDLLRTAFSTASVPEGVAGPVGIFSIAQETGKLGFVYLIQLLALISINLFVLNFLPFPALDGGRFLLLVIEKIKGSPISVRAEALVNSVGFVFLIVLIVGITVNDVVKLF